jgi:hypothetical protein
MSVRTWNAGTGQNTALFIMILFWALIILLAIAQTNWQWNAGTIIGLIFMIGILCTWVAGFLMGMFLRRVLKFLVIIIGSFLGAVFLVIQWMQARQYLQGVGADYAQPLAHILY